MAEETTILTESTQTNTEVQTENQTILDEAGKSTEVTTTADVKPDAETKTAEAKPAGAPEKYEDFKVPEGTTAKPEDVERVKAMAKELNLSQDAAQKLFDHQATQTKALTEQFQTQYKAQVNQWKDETIQWLGNDRVEKTRAASRGIDALGTPELKAFLSQTGLGNHKLLVEMFCKAGTLLSEDKFVEGKGTTGQKSAGQLFYPDMK